MEQRLRLVQGGQHRSDKRQAERLAIEVPGQIVWKDARGTTRMASVVTRDVSEQGVRVECLSGTPIPQYRLVYFQIDREARHRPDLPRRAAQVERALCHLPRRRLPAGDRRARRLRAAAARRAGAQGRPRRRRGRCTSRSRRGRPFAHRLDDVALAARDKARGCRLGPFSFARPRSSRRPYHRRAVRRKSAIG